MEAKADQLVHEAEQDLKKWSLFGGGDKYENAADKFQRAGNAYKAAKMWAEAASAYKKAADNYIKAKDEHGASSNYIEAARCYIRAGDGRTGIEVMERDALPRIVDAGRLSQAAKLHNEVAEMFEAENQYEEAIVNFQKAADFYSAENAGSSSSKCLLRIAHLSAQIEPPQFEKAAETFEQVGRDALSSNLLKFNAKGHFFNGLLCTLALGDIVAAEQKLARFKDLDYTFEDSREGRFCADVVQAYKDINDEAFAEAVYQYDQISKLDPWRVNVLLKIRAAIQKASGAAGEVDIT